MEQQAATLAAESRIRVGVVLLADQKRSQAFVLPAGGTFLWSSEHCRNTVETTAEMPGRIMLHPGEGGGWCLKAVLDCAKPAGHRRDWMMGQSISVVAQSPQSLRPGEGILLQGIVAGRSFHWEKTMDQTFLGAIHFIRSGEYVVVVNELPVETYLAGVVTAEMSSECPLSFVKAQAVAARSWYYANITGKHGTLFSHCNDDCCQRYQGTGGLSERAIRAVEETRGQVLANACGDIAGTNYAKCCGGIRARPKAIWAAGEGKSGAAGLGGKGMQGGAAGCANGRATAVTDAPAGSAAATYYPITEGNAREWLTGEWLKSTDIFCSPNVVSPLELEKYLGKVDAAGSYFRWTVTLSHEELKGLMRSRRGIDNVASVTGLEPLEREPSGRITELGVYYVDMRNSSRLHTIRGEYNIRRALSPSFLFSSAFVVDKTPGPDGVVREFQLRGGGWGHGVGMCQVGALGMALNGNRYEDILRHYYQDLSLKRLV